MGLDWDLYAGASCRALPRYWHPLSEAVTGGISIPAPGSAETHSFRPWCEISMGSLVFLCFGLLQVHAPGATMHGVSRKRSRWNRGTHAGSGNPAGQLSERYHRLAPKRCTCWDVREGLRQQGITLLLPLPEYCVHGLEGH